MPKFKIVEVNADEDFRHEEELMTPDRDVAIATFICRWNSKMLERKEKNIYFTLYQQQTANYGLAGTYTYWKPVREYFLGKKRKYD